MASQMNRGEAVQKQIQQDWVNREYIEIITISIKKITDFLNSFDLSCRSKLAGLNEKLTILERKIDYLEACVSDQGRNAYMKIAPPVHLFFLTTNRNMMQQCIAKTCKTATVLESVSRRGLFHWINLQFNTLDEERLKQLGPDRTCAEWILRNGGKVKWVDAIEYESDYNNLPKEEVQLKLQEIDATGSSIMANGFEHLKGCKYISKIVFHECNHLENHALKELSYVKDSLLFLQVSRCGNIIDSGLLDLVALHRLRNLIIFGLPFVKDRTKVFDALKKAMKQCKVTFDE